MYVCNFGCLRGRRFSAKVFECFVDRACPEVAQTETARLAAHGDAVDDLARGYVEVYQLVRTAVVGFIE